MYSTQVITAALSRTETFAALSRALGFPARLQGALAQIDALRANDAVCEDVLEAVVGGLHEELGMGVTSVRSPSLCDVEGADTRRLGLRRYLSR